MSDEKLRGSGPPPPGGATSRQEEQPEEPLIPIDLDDALVLDRESGPELPEQGLQGRRPREPVDLDGEVEDYVSSPFATAMAVPGGVRAPDSPSGSMPRVVGSPMTPRRAVSIGQDSVPPPAHSPTPAPFQTRSPYPGPQVPSRSPPASPHPASPPLATPNAGSGAPVPWEREFAAGASAEAEVGPSARAVGGANAPTEPQGYQVRPGAYRYTNLNPEATGDSPRQEGGARERPVPGAAGPEFSAGSGAPVARERPGETLEYEIDLSPDSQEADGIDPSAPARSSGVEEEATPVPPASEPVRAAPPVPFSMPPTSSNPPGERGARSPSPVPGAELRPPALSFPPLGKLPSGADSHPTLGGSGAPAVNAPRSVPPPADLARSLERPQESDTFTSAPPVRPVDSRPARSASDRPEVAPEGQVGERRRHSSVPPAAALAAAVQPHPDEFESPDLSLGLEPDEDGDEGEEEMRLSEADLEISIAADLLESPETPAVDLAHGAPDGSGDGSSPQESRKPPPPRRSAKPSLPAAKIRKRPWWETLFGDDFARAHRSPTPAQLGSEVDFILKSLEAAAGQVVLDLGCGQGEHAIEMSRRGLSVVGYDLSVFQLAMAGDRAQAESQKINFLQGDMREMAFEAMFDSVVCWNTTFGYFEEDKNHDVARRVHSALKPGGSLLLMVLNRDFAAREAPTNIWFEGDGCVCMDDVDFDWITSRLRVKRSLILDDGRSKELHYSMRLYNLSEIGKLLHGVGFRVVQVSGDVSTPGAFFGPVSPYIIIRAQRP